MRHRRAFILKAAVVVATVGGACVLAQSPSGASGVAPQPDRPVGPDVSQAHEMNLRAQFGLPAGLSHVQQVDRSNSATRTELGIPLAPEESANVAARDELGAIASRLVARGQHDPSFGGVWIDQASGGTLVVAAHATAGAPKLNRNLKADIPTATRLSVISAAFSYAQLTQTAARITDGAVAHDPLLRALVSSGVDVKKNRVSLVLKAGTTPSVVAALAKKFGPTTVVSTTPSYFATNSTPSPSSAVAPLSISRSAKTGPLYGGAWLSNGGPTAGGNCTAGFSNILNTRNEYYSVTAGHCGSGTYYEGRNRQGDVLGTGHSNGFIPGGSGNCDCVAVGPLASSHRSNSVLVDGNGLYQYSTTGGGGDFTAGMRACLSGAQSADTNNEHILCGQIVQGSVTITSFQGFTLIDAATVNFQPQDGDSGGPYGNSKHFLGIHSAFNVDLHEGAMTKAIHIAQHYAARIVY